MDKNAMRSFLSERNLSLHKEYLKNCRLRLSILEKSGFPIANKSYFELCGMRNCEAKAEILKLAGEIYRHELYFDSYGIGGESCDCLKARYGSLAGFLYEVERTAMREEGGFSLIYFDGNSAVIGHSSRELHRRYGAPRLAIDLDEHAYFIDYGFDKERYVKAAVSHLQILKLLKK